MKEVKSTDWHKNLGLCAKGKHKLRTNDYGVTWCTRCGLLSSTQNAEPLKDEDKLLIIKTEE